MRFTLNILLLLASINLIAQEGSITSAGNNTTASDKIISWSIGSTVSNISQSETYVVYQGPVLDTYKIRFEEENKIQLRCYPNPTIDGFFYTEVFTNDINGLQWGLYSSQGKQIQHGQITNDIFRVDLSGLSSSTYIMYIYDKSKTKIASAKLLKQ